MTKKKAKKHTAKKFHVIAEEQPKHVAELMAEPHIVVAVPKTAWEKFVSFFLGDE